MIVYLILLILIIITIILDSKKSLHMLQQNLYNENNRYLKWVIKNKKLFLNVQIIAIIVAIIARFVTTGIDNILNFLFIFLLKNIIGINVIVKIPQ